MTTRWRTLLIFSLALALILILAAGLGSLDLKPGQVFSIEKIYQQPEASGLPRDTNFWSVIFQAFQILLTILVIFYTIYMLIDKERRKRLLANLVLYALLFLVMSLIRQAIANQPKQDVQNVSGGILPTGIPGPVGTPAVFAPNPGDALVTVTAIILGGLSVVIAVLAWWFLARRRSAQPDAVDLLAAQAEETIEDLLSGKNLRETILICYRRMIEIVAKNRNLPREGSVTPHEFEQLLIAKNLPDRAVHDLTQIFEDIRYGDQNAGEEERRRAVSALRIIAAVCRTPENAS